MHGQQGNKAKSKPWLPLAVCSTFLLIFACLSYSAALRKSATIDEPVEALGSWTQLHLHDFRMNFEHPALWHFLAALPNGKDAIHFSQQDDGWVQMPSESTNQLALAKRVLYQTSGNDGAAFVNRSRFAMLILSIGIGVLIATWAWQLAGPTAAMIATALFAFDPNLIGHASLVKNDMALALAMTAALLAAWRVGSKLTLFNFAALALIVAAAINVKFSAVLLAPILLSLLMFRACSRQPWNMIGMDLRSWPTKSAAVIGLLTLILGVSTVGIWACYGFRFNPSPNPRVALNRLGIRNGLLINPFQSQHPRPMAKPFDLNVSVAEQVTEINALIDAYQSQQQTYLTTVWRNNLPGHEIQLNATALVPQEMRSRLAACVQMASSLPPAGQRNDAMNEQELFVRLIMDEMIADLQKGVWELQVFTHMAQTPLDASTGRFSAAVNFMIDRRMLPSAWLNGLLKVYTESLYRGSFLVGQTRGLGWWYYFPLAALFKSSVAGGLAMLLALGIGIRIVIQRIQVRQPLLTWSLACLLIPFAVYLATALTTSSDIGWRYLIPLYPFMYITAGVILAGAVQRWRRVGVVIAGLGVLLFIETVSAFPNYIAYFNFIAGGPRGGFRLLSDSNLDWSQDLPLLAQWQRDHPGVPLALSYFGDSTIDPAYYGIKADYLPPGYPPPQFSRDHILAVSATRIQNPYGDRYDVYQQFTPSEVLGGTIYLYDLRKK